MKKILQLTGWLLIPLATMAQEYCGPFTFTNPEPITWVNFAGIDNETSATSTESHEFFLDQIGEVEQGGSYSISIRGVSGYHGAPAMPPKTQVTLFIDWNQDGIFGQEETLYLGPIVGISDGLPDSYTLTNNDIIVPPDALLGSTRMRIKKNYIPTFQNPEWINGNPCTGGEYGQFEDYTINVVPPVQQPGIPTPFLETFNDDSPTRDNWTQTQVNGNGVWNFLQGSNMGVIQPYEGDKNAWFYLTNPGYITKFITPPLDISTLETPTLTFQYYLGAASGGQYVGSLIKVYYRKHIDDEWKEIHDGMNPHTASLTWRQRTLILPESSDTYQLAFEANAGENGHSILIDHVAIDEYQGGEYCSPVSYDEVQAITYFSFAGLEHESPVNSHAFYSHEFFNDPVGNYADRGKVIKGDTYEVIIEGNTGDGTHNVVLFADWNQNGILDDAGEVYELGTLSNSTGTDGIQLTASINIPEGASLGETRIRIKKIAGTQNLTNPCAGADFGQTEDYTIKIIAPESYHEQEFRGDVHWSTPITPSGSSNYASATDIDVEAGRFLHLDKIEPLLSSPSNNFTTVRVRILDDNNGLPGNSLTYMELTPASVTLLDDFSSPVDKFYKVKVVFPEPVVLCGAEGTGSKYWIALQVNGASWLVYEAENLVENNSRPVVYSMNGGATWGVHYTIPLTPGNEQNPYNPNDHSWNSNVKAECYFTASGIIEDGWVTIEPVTESPVQICYGSTAELTVNGTFHVAGFGDYFHWYESETSEEIIGTEATFVTPPLTENKTYWVKAGNCAVSTERIPIEVIVVERPELNIQNSTLSVCYGSTATLEVNTNTSLVYWYTSAETETPVHTGASFVTPELTENTSYWVAAEVDGITGCITDRVEIVSTILPAPELDIEDTTPEVCSGSYAVLNATSPGNVIFWYDSEDAEEYLLHGNQLITPDLTENISYWVEAYNIFTGCTSERVEVIITIIPTPDAAEAVTIQYFEEGATLADLEVDYTGDITWYADENLTVELPSTTPLVAFTTYYVTQTINGCESAATAITVEPELGTNDLGGNAFSYYPNPVQDVLVLKGKQTIEAVNVYDSSGRKVKSFAANAVEVNVDFRGLLSGTYIVEVKSRDEVKTIKIIKK